MWSTSKHGITSTNLILTLRFQIFNENMFANWCINYVVHTKSVLEIFHNTDLTSVDINLYFLMKCLPDKLLGLSEGLDFAAVFRVTFLSECHQVHLLFLITILE